MKSIILTGIGGDIAHAIARIIRAERSDLSIIGCDIHEQHAGTLYCDHFEVVPRADDLAYLPAMRALLEAYDADLLLPVTEAELAVIGPLTQELGTQRCITAGPAVIAAGLDNLATADILRESGIAAPWTVLAVGTPPEVPCIVKKRTGSGSRAVFIARSEEEALELSHRHPGSIYQELLGDSTQELTCAVYRDRAGSIRSLLMLRRLVGGMTSWARIITDAASETMCTQVAEALDLRGSMNIQIRLTANGPRIFEINPRFSSTVEMRHILGFSDLLWAIDESEGRQVPAPMIAEGQIVVRTQGAAIL